jgi:hypothetical protein
LHHRTSEDLDFFLTRELEPTELAPLVAAIRTAATTTDIEVVGPRTSLILTGRTKAMLPMKKIDIAALKRAYDA